MNESLIDSALDKERLSISEVKQIRPWVRFWARSIDIFVGIILIALLAYIFIPQALTLGIISSNFIVLILLMLFEAILLSTWGMTIGKSLFQVYVRNSQGKKLNFLQAIKRCIFVWMWGLGFGIPFVFLITAGMSYQHIEEKGVAKWDMQGNTFVSHRKIGVFRIAVIAVTTILFIGLIWLAK